jgi:hypothetical protein
MSLPPLMRRRSPPSLASARSFLENTATSSATGRHPQPAKRNWRLTLRLSTNRKVWTRRPGQQRFPNNRSSVGVHRDARAGSLLVDEYVMSETVDRCRLSKAYVPEKTPSRPWTSCSIQCQEGIGGRIGRQEGSKTIRTIAEVVIVVIVVSFAVRFL